jgi:hypothetical protein
MTPRTTQANLELPSLFDSEEPVFMTQDARAAERRRSGADLLETFDSPGNDPIDPHESCSW